MYVNRLITLGADFMGSDGFEPPPPPLWAWSQYFGPKAYAV